MSTRNPNPYSIEANPMALNQQYSKPTETHRPKPTSPETHRANPVQTALKTVPPLHYSNTQALQVSYSIETDITVAYNKPRPVVLHDMHLQTLGTSLLVHKDAYTEADSVDIALQRRNVHYSH